MKTLIFSLCVFFSFSNLLAQNSNFRVLLTEGANTFGQNQFITIGTEIPENQTLNFQGAYLAMIDSEGKTVEITEKGIYEVKNLKGKMNFKVNNLWKKYSQDEKFYFGKEARKLPKTGSVTCAPAVRFLQSFRTGVYGNTMYLSWEAFIDEKYKKKIQSYNVYLVDLADKIFKEYSTKEQTITISLHDSVLAEQKIFLAKVVYITNDSLRKEYVLQNLSQIDGIVIEKLDSADNQAITQEISQIQKPEAPILSQLVLANYFEEKELLIDARLAYIKLLEMKDLAIFRALYQNFLYRNRLTKEAYLEEDK